jgi:hypothetical protein
VEPLWNLLKTLRFIKRFHNPASFSTDLQQGFPQAKTYIKALFAAFSYRAPLFHRPYYYY